MRAGRTRAVHFAFREMTRVILRFQTSRPLKNRARHLRPAANFAFVYWSSRNLTTPEDRMETETKEATKKLTVRCQFCNTWNRIDATKVTAGPKCGKCGKPILLERPIPLTEETFTRT